MGKLNCRPGDLAIVVPPINPASCGRVVTVLRLAMPFEELDGGTFRTSGKYGVAWVCRMSRRGDVVLADCGLRAIRDQSGDDETLAWAGKPKGNYFAMLKGFERASKVPK